MFHAGAKKASKEGAIMRIFKATCIDTETGHEMILSDASYNAACFYLDNRFDVVDITMENGLAVILTRQGRFYYDEIRGYLMRERG